MKTYTREQIAYLLHINLLQVHRYCQGFYFYNYTNTQGVRTKQKIWYQENGLGVQPLSGNGTKGHPWKYTLKSFRDYIKE